MLTFTLTETFTTNVVQWQLGYVQLAAAVLVHAPYRSDPVDAWSRSIFPDILSSVWIVTFVSDLSGCTEQHPPVIKIA
jgi:hypothetical protein